ncbi:glycosyltransferase family 25 protein [Psittacicella hinzii]|uniref:Glycosyl transferase family 25 domain-containing protein n=1 Tax=Psittacicella hinzii TaxID=2028575 RepID=A0A3A1YVD0_9GAMM|nr:glycosyltransferase family 25 protein [Psittacicella hinzii]RIY40017.1 hypothetical protein CKF58_01240 [Psittacicella hinzii]
MTKLPLLASIPKFVIEMPTGNKPELDFFHQPYAAMFTPIKGVDIVKLMLERGQISQEMANLYHPAFEFDINAPGFTTDEYEHAPFLKALQPYFDFYKYKEQCSPLPSTVLSIQSVNEAISVNNLLAHVALDPNIANGQWVLVCEDQVNLHPEWAWRLESILASYGLSGQLQRDLCTQEQLVALEQRTTAEERQYLNNTKYIFLSYDKNASFAQLSKEELDNLGIYPESQIDTDVSSYTYKLNSILGQQEINPSNVFNFYRGAFFLIRKPALSEKIAPSVIRALDKLTYGQAFTTLNSSGIVKVQSLNGDNTHESVPLAVSEQAIARQQADLPEYLKQTTANWQEYHTLLPFDGNLYWTKDAVHFIMEFTTHSVAMANPALGVHTRKDNANNLHDAQAQQLALQASMALGFEQQSHAITSHGYDYLSNIRKYVMTTTDNQQYLGRFFSQENTKNFTAWPLPSIEKWDLEQVEQSYYYPIDMQRSQPVQPRLETTALTLAQRELLLSIVNDQTIADDDFVLIAKDRALLRPSWYNTLNKAIGFMHQRYPECNLLFTGIGAVESGFRPIDDPNFNTKLELLRKNNLHTQQQDWVHPLGADLEAAVSSSYIFSEYPLVLIRKKALTQKLQADDYRDRSKLYLDRYASLFEFKVGSCLWLNPSLALVYSQEKISQNPSAATQEDHSVDYLLHGEVEQQDLNKLIAEYPGKPQDMQQALIQAQIERINPLPATKLPTDEDITRADYYKTGELNAPYVPENLDTSDLTAEQAAKIAADKPWYFGTDVPITELIAQQEPELQAKIQQKSPELQNLAGYARAGFLPDKLAKVKKYVINLPSSVDRLQAFMQQSHIADFYVHHAVIGKNLNQEEKEAAFDIPRYHARYNREMQPGEYGCSLSHTQILRKALYDPELDLDDWVMIIEDDTKLHPDWYNLLNQILIYVEYHLRDRVMIINGAQNQVPHFNFLEPEEFCSVHSLNSIVPGYHEIAPDTLGIGLLQKPFPAGAGFYLIKKRLLVAERKRIEGKIDWVGDDIAAYYRFRPGMFAYTNPQMGYDDTALESILNAERIASLEREKIKLRSVPLTSPSEYLQASHYFVIQKSLSEEEINRKFPGFTIIPFKDYAALPRAEQEELFDFERFKQSYGREITPAELNLTLAHQAAWNHILQMPISNFTFHFIVEDDQELIHDYKYKLNCLCDYVDTRLDLDTLLIMTSNSIQEQSFENKLPYEQWEANHLFVPEDKYFHVNDEIDIGVTTRKTPNGSGSYIFLKFVPSVQHHYLTNGTKRFFLASDYVLGMPYSVKSIAVCQPPMTISSQK